MGSRGIRRLFRRARADVRRRRREAMIGACNDVVAHLAQMIATSAEREAARRMWPGFDGLMPMDLKWPEPLSALHPPLVQGNGLYTGTIGGRSRVHDIINPAALDLLAFTDGERKTRIEFDILIHRPPSHVVLRVE